MLAGRYPSDEFAELRPRIVWDRTGGVIRGRSGARQLAVQNAGTIPDRGLYGVHLVDGGGRVGELDEEMVYEARAGQTFTLGASTWRIEEITRDRVLVSPAPGVPGLIPFWKGEGPGRPYELGEAIGRASRELVALSEQKALERLTEQHSLDEQAAQNLLTFLGDQQKATGAVPSDRTVVVERFRDEIGDWRVCVLTPFGARVHAPWAMAIGIRLRDALGLEAQSLWSDDGIAIHLPEADAPPPTEELIIDPTEIEDLVMGELSSTALFGSRFRENAARALLIPRRRPGQRTPLWQQRLKAQSLLQVARRYGSFPVILETYRECLQDVFDLPALEAAPERAQDAGARPGRRRDGVRLAVLELAPLRLRRHVHVRGRHASGGASRTGALARPGSPQGAARPGRAARADRPGRARGGRDAAARCASQPGRAARRAAPARRSSSRILRRGACGAAPRRAARDHGADRRRGAPGRGRGRGTVPRRARCDASRWAAGDVPRGRGGLAGEPRRALRQGPWPVHDRGGERPLRAGRRAAAARARAGGTARPRRAPARRDRARVVRSRRPASSSPRVPRCASQGGRARGAGGVRPVPAELARDRPAREPARGARPAPGAAASGLALGERGAAAARAGLPAGPARSAVRDR